MFPSKIGGLIVGLVNACFSIVVTVGKQVKVPGNSGMIALGFGMLLPGAMIYKEQLSKIQKRTNLMLKSLYTLPSRMTAQAHTAAVSVGKGSTNLSRAQIGSSLFLGLILLSASTSFADSSDKAQNDIVSLVEKVTNFLLLLLAAAVVGMAAWGAFLYVTSAGSQRRTGMAKETIKNVFIGLALAAAIFLIRSVVLGIIGAVDTGGSGSKVRKKLEDGGL